MKTMNTSYPKNALQHKPVVTCTGNSHNTTDPAAVVGLLNSDLHNFQLPNLSIRSL